jgi:hypothetical protein
VPNGQRLYPIVVIARAGGRPSSRGLRSGQEIRRGAEHLHLQPDRSEQAAERLAHRRIVVDDIDDRRFGTRLWLNHVTVQIAPLAAAYILLQNSIAAQPRVTRAM